MKMFIFIVLFVINLSKSFVIRQRPTRLAGAKLVSPGEFPFVVLTFTVESRCTASLISPEWVLSAAHCFFRKGKPIGAKDILVVAGATNFLNTSGPYIQERIAKEVNIHPNFRPLLSMHDIALIKVEAFNFNRFISKIPLKSSSFPLNTQVPCTAMGWGDVDASTPTSELHKLAVIAEQSVRACPGLSEGERSRLICLKQENGRGLCDGDSGSPLFCSGELVGIAHEVYTIVESTKAEPPMECGDTDLVMTYMFVCPYLNWIRTYVGMTPNKPSYCHMQTN